MASDPVATIGSQLLKMIFFLGTEGAYTITKTNVTTQVKGLISPMDRRDTELIQSYGVNGMRLTFKADSFTTRPVRYDTWVANGRKFVFDACSEIIIKGEVVGYTVYCKGTVG